MNKNIFYKFMLISMLFLFANAKELKVIAPWEVTGLEPTQSGKIFQSMQVAENLVGVNEIGELIPALATTWSVSNDGLVWTFNLRDGVKFHDGSSLNASIVEYNLNTSAVLKKSILSYLPLKSIKAKGKTIEVTLTSKFNSLPAYFAHYSTVILAKKSFDENAKVINMIASGAYAVNKITLPLKVKLIRNENWWNGKANIKEASYLAVGKGETRALMIKSQEADIAYNILPTSIKSLKKNPNLNVEFKAIPRARMLKVNSGSEFFNTAELREAISLAINRKAISKVILKNEDLAATQMFPVSMSLWHNKELKPLSYNIKKANKLLDNAGWKKQSDGFRYKDGKKFEITLDTYNDRPELPVIATAIQAQLKKIGVDLKLLIGSYTEIIRKHKDNTLHLGLISRNFVLVPNPLGTLLQDYGKGGANWGAMNWKNETMFKYLDKLKSSDNRQLQYKVTELLQNELPSIPLAWSEKTVVSNKRVNNVKVDPLEINFFLAQIKWTK